MANIYRNINIHGLTDVLGGAFMYRARSGKTMITKAPILERGNNKTPKRHLAAILEASTYANFARTQEVYLHQEQITGISAYCFALEDWFSGPRVLKIDVDAWTGRAGQSIRVKARDNLKVAAVAVVIRDAAGNVLEMGEAMPSPASGPWWTYTTQSRVPMNPFPCVEAIAVDLPGNRDSFTIS
jgi:hypothetical protein